MNDLGYTPQCPPNTYCMEIYNEYLYVRGNFNTIGGFPAKNAR
ncbi:MAG: hypothetical protein AB8G11_24920 [Saprospiraceae bacterium]